VTSLLPLEPADAIVPSHATGMPEPATVRSVWRLTIRQVHQDGALIVSPAGRLGSRGSAELVETLMAALIRGHGRIVLDLAGVDYLSSSGLLALEAALARVRAEGGDLVLCNVTAPVRLALDLAGLLPQVGVRDSADATATSPSTTAAARPGQDGESQDRTNE
jgi:anti-anti-sigma factor